MNRYALKASIFIRVKMRKCILFCGSVEKVKSMQFKVKNSRRRLKVIFYREYVYLLIII